jgi:polar amino acid transport system substrate-binding protein
MKITFSFLLLLCISLHSTAQTLTLTTENAPPFNYFKEDNKTITGIGTDIVGEALKRANVSANTVVYPWQRAYSMAVDGKNTCVFSTTRTAEREPLFKWVGPLIKNTWVLYGKADTSIVIAKLEDAKSLIIGGYNGDALSIYFKERGYKVDDALNDTQNLQKLQAGRIDVWAAGGLSGPFLAAQQKIKIKPLISFNETGMYLACNPSVLDDTIQKMNAAIAAMWTDGTIDKINRKYGAVD